MPPSQVGKLRKTAQAPQVTPRPRGKQAQIPKTFDGPAKGILAPAAINEKDF